MPLHRSRRRWSDRYKDLQTAGSGRVPVPVEDAEIEALRAVVASRLRVEPWPYMQVGQRVVIESGSLAGLEGILQEVRKSFRLVVSVDLLQRSVAVEVDRDWVRPVESAAACAV